MHVCLYMHTSVVNTHTHTHTRAELMVEKIYVNLYIYMRQDLTIPSWMAWYPSYPQTSTILLPTSLSAGITGIHHCAGLGMNMF